MPIILKCVKSNNQNFTEGRRYLFVDGTLTCDAHGFSSNVYITDKIQKESRDPILRTVEDVNKFFESRQTQLHFIEDTITTDNWYL